MYVSEKRLNSVHSFFGGSMSKRIEWIDTLRGFGILVVVIGHLKPEAILERYIYSFHMFLFFAISGFLFREGTDLWLLLKKKAKRLLVPYFFWTFLASVQALISGEGVVGALKVFIMYDGSVGWNRPLWFLSVIFAAELVYGLLRKYCRFSNWICLLVCPWIWYMLKGELLTMKLDNVPLAVFFISFGNILKSVLSSQLFEKYRKYIVFLILPASAYLHILCGVLNNRRLIFTYAVYGRYDMCLLGGMAGVLFFFVLFQWIGKSRILTYFSRYSMFIMCSHYYLMHLLGIVSLKLINVDLWNARGTAKAVLLGIVIVAILSAIGERLGQKSKDKPILQTCMQWIGL